MRSISLGVVVIVFSLVLSLASLSSGYVKELDDLETLQITGRNTEKYKLANDIVGEPACPEDGKNGVYYLKPVNATISSFPVYCDYTYGDEGWIVIHRRYNGFLSFNRTWRDYREGFGKIHGEHWLGLEKMHQITREGSYELTVVVKSMDDNFGIYVEEWSRFEGFKIGSELEQFQLKLERFSDGTAGSPDLSLSNCAFSTPDRDNRYKCEKKLDSGWWWCRDCDDSTNLNRMENCAMLWENRCKKEARIMIRAVESRK